ncbi:PQQ-binding-like beta-propeller repeat protein [Halosimplex rubrum]|uniref:PQQ-binding-like beta-propeller repeat protein n=1 Tax=Halosimplex rubrum TaxID=869889 RepID=A0A7D5P5N8_9EURY|nr:PQQ-binding-like beta-propeller repeat protein [Halosimplex rubrum]QLH79801.1 PQQ-binding-like beta-propeller repeat protein [Halosimplex rubrum]
MPTRRRTLALAAGLVATAGCLGDGDAATGTDPPSDDATPTDRPTTGQTDDVAPSETPTPAPDGTPTVAGTDEPRKTADRATPAPPATVTRVSGELPDWTADRWIDTDYAQVLGLDAGDRRLYVTMSNDGGRSAVAALSPDSAAFDWVQSFAGEAEAGSHHEPTDATDTWGVTVGDGTVYSVHGRGESYEWTALHALDAATGTERWSFERERRLGIAGFLDGAVVVRATEFFEPEHSHDTPEEPLETTVHAVDTAGGDSRWSASVAGLSGLAVGSDAVYAAGGRSLSAYDAGGDRLWERGLAAPVRLATVLGDTLVCSVGESDDDASLVGVSTDGERLWARPLSARWFVPTDDRLYVGNDSVAAVAADGTVAWRERAYAHDPLLDADENRLYTRTNPRMNAVDAYDLPGGDRPYRFVTPSNNGWPVAATAGTLVAEAITPEEADFTSLFAVDAATGEPRAVYRPSDSVFSVTGFEGAVYAGFGNGKLGVFPNVR